MEWAVEVEDMTVAYTTKPVLWDVDMKVPIGSLAAIVGPNGAGKSTLLKAMLGLLTVISGSVKFYIDHHLAMDKKDYKKIAYVPQSGSVGLGLSYYRIRRCTYGPLWSSRVVQTTK